MPVYRRSRQYLYTSEFLLIEGAATFRRWHVRLQKISYALIGVDLILYLGEPVPFVLVNLGFNHATALFDRIYNLLSFTFGTTWIMSPRQEQ